VVDGERLLDAVLVAHLPRRPDARVVHEHVDGRTRVGERAGQLGDRAATRQVTDHDVDAQLVPHPSRRRSTPDHRNDTKTLVHQRSAHGIADATVAAGHHHGLHVYSVTRTIF
jgi:hypothetical protein